MRRIIKICCILLVLIMTVTAVSVNAITWQGEDISFYYHPGDVSGDKNITIYDVTLLQKYLINLKSVEDIKGNADINGDGKLNVNDVTNIQRYLANIEYDCSLTKEYDYFVPTFSNPTEATKEVQGEKITELYGFIECALEDFGSTQYRHMFLITSKEQFLATTNYYSPSLDDYFFSEYALFLWIEKEDCFEDRHAVTKFLYDKDTLYVGINDYFIGESTDAVSPINPTWNIIYALKKSDIQGIEKIHIFQDNS